MGTAKIWLGVGTCVFVLARSTSSFAQADPAAEPAVLAIAKVLPAVVNINTERVVRRTVRDPIEDFYAQFLVITADGRARFGKHCKVSDPGSLSIQPATS